MDAVQLFSPTGIPAGVWMCGKCRRLQSRWWQAYGKCEGHTYTDAERDELARLAAVRCCDHRCETCGEKAREGYDLCDRHRDEKWAADSRANEAKRFEAATKLTAAEWAASEVGGNMLYSEAGDRWFRDLDEAEEWYADDPAGRTRPAYLWCSAPTDWRPDVSGDIADAIHAKSHGDAADGISDADWKKLDAVVDAWWDEHGPTSYEPDYSRCVVLDPPPEA